MLGALTFTALVASVSAIALPAPKPNPVLAARQGQTSAPAYSTYSRLNPTYNATQLQELKLAYTEVERLALLKSYGNTDDYFKFDFTPAGFVSNAGNGLGGNGYLAAVQNFPVLMGTGLSMAIGYLNPCGLDSQHIHNRATEMVILVAGQSLKTGFVLEDGFDEPVLATIGLYQGVIRPQGSIHYEFNDNCEPAIFIAGLSSEDPAVQRTAQSFFVQDSDIVDADLGYPDFLNNVDISKFYSGLPAAFAQGAQECFARCNLTRTNNTAV